MHNAVMIHCHFWAKKGEFQICSFYFSSNFNAIFAKWSSFCVIDEP